MKKWVFAAAMACLSIQAFAYQALAPNQQMANEVKDILSSTEVMENFPTGVRSFERVQTGYILHSDLGSMKVEVIRFGAQQYGPTQYKLRFCEMDRSTTDNMA